MLNNVISISVLHIARNVIVVEKPITEHECAAQSPSMKQETNIQEILEDTSILEQKIDKIGNNRPIPVI